MSSITLDAVANVAPTVQAVTNKLICPKCGKVLKAPPQFNMDKLSVHVFADGRCGWQGQATYTFMSAFWVNFPKGHEAVY